MNYIHYIVIAFIILLNIITNITMLKTYSNNEYFREFYTKHWLLRIPYVVWYWMETLVRFKLIKDLVFFLSTAALVYILAQCVVWSIKYTWLFPIVLGIITTAAAILLYFCLQYAFIKLYKFIKKKKRKQNKRNKR